MRDRAGAAPALCSDRARFHEASLLLEVPTIELAGGSVRCMLAGIHLAARNLARDAA
jgi:hypothetical protein